MHWQIIAGTVAIVVHTDEAPSDEEWDAYLAELVQSVSDINGLLVYSDKVGPSAPQRARSNEAFARAGKDIKTAIMTGSRVVRGIITAMNWALDGRVKPFTTLDFEGAMNYLGLDTEQQIRTRVALRQLARAAGTEIEAFADESGRFRKKFQ